MLVCSAQPALTPRASRSHRLSPDTSGPPYKCGCGPVTGWRNGPSTCLLTSAPHGSEPPSEEETKLSSEDTGVSWHRHTAASCGKSHIPEWACNGDVVLQSETEHVPRGSKEPKNPRILHTLIPQRRLFERFNYPIICRLFSLLWPQLAGADCG